jgi:pimeloyl-ACP methyl ester carboxylesterase
MATMVLIHGSWHGGWCWEELVPLLEAKGHHVLAPNSPGMGSDHTLFAEDIFGQWVDAATVIVEAQSEPVVLVGHSRGATIVSAVAERVPDKLAQVIYLTGYALADGEALTDVRAASDDVYAAVVPNDDGSAVGVDPALAPDLFYNRCSPEVAARAVARLCLEPLQPGSVKMTLSDKRFGRVPRAYIEASEDRALPLAFQREAQKRWPFDRVATLPSDHSPFFSMPDQLAEVLDDLAFSR